MRSPRYDDDGFCPIIKEVLDDSPSPAAGTEDDAVLILHRDAGMSQRAAESAVICIVSEGAVIGKVDRIDSSDNPGFPRDIRQIGHNV